VKDRILLTALVVAVVTSGTVAVVGAPVGGAEATAASATTADMTFAQQQSARIQGSPDLDANAPSPTLTPGEVNQVTVQITNDGDVSYGPSSLRSVVTTARNVRVEGEADKPLTVESGKIAIGSVTESRPSKVTLAVSVPEGIEPGEYDLDLDIEYSYTAQQTDTFSQDRNRFRDLSVELEVSEDARFEIVEARTDAQVGDTGSLEATIKNTGSETARDINVGLESMSAGLSFGSGIASDSSRLGELEPGETGTVTYDVGFAPNTPIREYALDGTVSFETPDGLQRVDDGPTTSVSPVAEQRFSIGDIESDLYVGEAGNIHGTVTNEGPLTARNVVVKYAGQSPNIVPLEDSVAVGTLEAGASGEFRLPIEVSSEAEAITRSANIVVQYRDDDFDSRAYQELELLFDVDPKRDRFDVEVTNRTIEAGGTRTLSVDVTNNLNETVSDVEARMFADDPMSTGNTDTGYVQSIDPGETVTMRFDLAASGSATPGSTYPISFDLRFDDSDGDSQLSNTIRAPVEVTESADDGFSLPFIGGSLLTALAGAGGVVWYRRQ
jgi:hypothetical protein